jgi:hypothetical protein
MFHMFQLNAWLCFTCDYECTMMLVRMICNAKCLRNTRVLQCPSHLTAVLRMRADYYRKTRQIYWWTVPKVKHPYEITHLTPNYILLSQSSTQLRPFHNLVPAHLALAHLKASLARRLPQSRSRSPLILDSSGCLNKHITGGGGHNWLYHQ